LPKVQTDVKNDDDSFNAIVHLPPTIATEYCKLLSTTPLIDLFDLFKRDILNQTDSAEVTWEGLTPAMLAHLTAPSIVQLLPDH
jgi:hypothetical protein